MELHRYDIDVELEGLVGETRSVVADWNWRRGAYGHALSLPAYHQLHPSARYGYGNYPCTGLLDRLPLFQRVFDGLRCEKVSFRLLRRGPGSAYGWHTDRWKGPGVVRFQIPIVSDESAFLVITDYDDPERIDGRLSAASFDAFACEHAGHFRRHHLEPGRLHYFDTTRVHTLVNPGPGERITLSFDLVANDWLLDRYPAARAELGDGPPEPLPRPVRMRTRIAWAKSRLYPLRNSARRWRPS